MSDSLDLMEMFREEAGEYVEGLNTHLLRLEVAGEEEEIAALLRELNRIAHSLKGSSRVVKVRPIELVAHEMETIFELLGKGELKSTPDLFDRIYDGVDAIEGTLGLESPDGGVPDLDVDGVVANLRALWDEDAPKKEKSAPPESPLDALNARLTELEVATDPDEAARLLNELGGIMRNMAGQVPEEAVPALESVGVTVTQMQSGAAEPSPELFDSIYDDLDVIRAAMRPPPKVPEKPEDVEAKAPPKPPELEPPPTAINIPSPRSTDETIRVSINKLDDLMAHSSELLVIRTALHQLSEQVKGIRENHDDWQIQWRQARATFIRAMRQMQQGELDELSLEDWQVLLNFIDQTQRYMHTANSRLLRLDGQMTDDTLRLSRVANDMQDGVRRVRMLPFETILSGFERMVRDLARDLKKEVQFVIRGAEVELDKRVLESLKDPLRHLLRNAIDHGLESPDDREAAGKERRGTITLDISQKGSEITIALSDDGRGINTNAVKQAAIRSRLITEAEASAMSDKDAYSLIMAAGLSTSRRVTEISGRGVGMDVVRRQIESLRGRVDIDSTPGQGTTFRCVVPLSLTTLWGILAQINDELYAIPLSSVVQIVEITPEDVITVEGRRMLKTASDGTVLLVSLAEVLERPQASRRDDADSAPANLAIILSSGDRHAAFLVDDLRVEQELVVKAFGLEFERVRNVAAVTLLGSGQPVLILNVADLIRSAMRGRQRTVIEVHDRPLEERAGASILVVDDSLTTRMLEKNILDAAGFDVTTASDGLEALDLLGQRTFDLVVSDIEMPNMDGFDLTEAIKGEGAFAGIPVILVTSLASKEDRERGIAAGADAYIVKSSFDQDELLQIVRQLV